MTVYAVTTGDYYCEGCMNSYCETIHGVYDSKEKAEKALEDLVTKAREHNHTYYRAFVAEYELQ